MSSEASLGTQHNTPHVESSKRRHSTDADLLAEMACLCADVTKITEKYDHLRTKMVNLSMTAIP
ncbi:unnamed protein product [Prunus armeniaca]